MGKVRVEAVPGAKFQQRLTSGKHTWVSDEPTEVGGTDLGPDPYALLLGALGACTSMTIRLYAQKKGWPVPHVEIELEHQRVHAKDCEECESDEGYVDRVERRILLEGELTDEQRARLMEIARRCPVHKTFHSETVVVDSTLPPGR
jgi:putative redox protein